MYFFTDKSDLRVVLRVLLTDIWYVSFCKVRHFLTLGFDMVKKSDVLGSYTFLPYELLGVVVYLLIEYVKLRQATNKFGRLMIDIFNLRLSLTNTFIIQ